MIDKNTAPYFNKINFDFTDRTLIGFSVLASTVAITSIVILILTRSSKGVSLKALNSSLGQKVTASSAILSGSVILAVTILIFKRCFFNPNQSKSTESPEQASVSQKSVKKSIFLPYRKIDPTLLVISPKIREEIDQIIESIDLNTLEISGPKKGEPYRKLTDSDKAFVKNIGRLVGYALYSMARGKSEKEKTLQAFKGEDIPKDQSSGSLELFVKGLAAAFILKELIPKEKEPSSKFVKGFTADETVDLMIEALVSYYTEFDDKQEEVRASTKTFIATILSFIPEDALVFMLSDSFIKDVLKLDSKEDSKAKTELFSSEGNLEKKREILKQLYLSFFRDKGNLFDQHPDSAPKLLDHLIRQGGNIAVFIAENILKLKAKEIDHLRTEKGKSLTLIKNLTRHQGIAGTFLQVGQFVLPKETADVIKFFKNHADLTEASLAPLLEFYAAHHSILLLANPNGSPLKTVADRVHQQFKTRGSSTPLETNPSHNRTIIPFSRKKQDPLQAVEITLPISSDLKHLKNLVETQSTSPPTPDQIDSAFKNIISKLFYEEPPK